MRKALALPRDFPPLKRGPQPNKLRALTFEQAQRAARCTCDSPLDALNCRNRQGWQARCLCSCHE
jgi:hypothetical protein